MLKNKTIVVGITGGIAAYKAVEVVSRLKKLGANVHVIMTEAATKFVQPLTFRSLSHNPVIVDMFGEPQSWDVEHISLAEKADMFLVVPATANLIGKVANGIADDMLSTTIMATTAKVVFSPAMNVNMYQNSIVQKNILSLKEEGYRFIEPDKGYLACGTEGKGRLPAPEEVVTTSVAYLLSPLDLVGKKVLITAGGTQEDLDPVRYLGNRSSGKMGYALARVAKARGAEVTLISAPTQLNKPSGVKVINVRTAAEMYQQVFKYQEEQDIIVMAAAVADYTPEFTAKDKIKKSSKLTLELERTTDILAELGNNKGDQILVGFAAESNDLVVNAQKKLKKKSVDFIVANDISAQDTGFASDFNQVVIISKADHIEVAKATKLQVADRIFSEIVKILD
ncbi:bifunctional phosphopantothenoylcysteine decarboxylase/phosphopantothenate--cysteine ligase CoaBC [Natroniella sulfidigena]|uniref:bifunctional phosphopantothenoylcysteine decarboxylase/phosphopantothenate--cysteine ligase CoaBC n=1 Tax=Natroniella sulfidigena TaxID=723921 RepID=UPI00200B86B3|nr:bifunctional phosphopantothenoylcysteine decarboxylase/phosphopantothenate--cysteine ligase CoaBC [Natroniella sulfidigena]MCK8818215.1 bifunctional phosphopantothenoylcysteine decarboxylase/phosphopantothenate--cysteine ligase CoaBC [Natroniella sulfidigena]